MESEDNLKTLLSAVTQYMKNASRSDPKFETSEKWIVLNPSDPPAEKEAHVYHSFDAATKARKSSGDDQQHTFGALTVIFNMDDGDGWYGHPIQAIQATRNNTTIVGQRNKKPYLWEYPSNKFTTFVIVVPTVASSHRLAGRTVRKRRASSATRRNPQK